MKKLCLYGMLLVISSLLLAEEPCYYSQYRQDKFVNENFFHNKRNGIFIDIGANDGVTINNSYFFEKYLGWTGICVEPLAPAFKKLQENRTSICVNGCIANFNGEGIFLMIESHPDKVGTKLDPSLLSGLINKYDKPHWDYVSKYIQANGVKAREISVQCFRLNDLLEKYNIKHVDYLSIDTEGGELEILKSIDFNKFDIDIIDVENNCDNQEFRAHLERHGYQFVHKIGRDELYKKVAK